MAIRRIKSYTGQTGFVYQYYYVGKRAALDPARANSTEYVFDVTADRRTMFAVSIFVSREALERWAEQHGRSLTETEQYAAAKMRLLQAFDEVRDLIQGTRQFTIDPEDIGALLEQLDLG